MTPILIHCIFLITVYRTNSSDVIQWVKNNEYANLCTNTTFVVNCKDHVDDFCSNYLDNVGEECYSILNYITSVYDKRDDQKKILFSIPGSVHRIKKRRIKFYKILQEVMKRKGDITYVDHGATITFKSQSNFTKRHHQGSTVNQPRQMIPASIEPFREWFRHYFGDSFPEDVTHSQGIFAVDTKRIHNHPLELYLKLLEETKKGLALEVCHYLERSWRAMWI